MAKTTPVADMTLGQEEDSDSSKSAERQSALTPSSAEKEPKKAEPADVKPDQSISKERDGGVVTDIHECIITRVNEALSGSILKDVTAGENLLLKQTVPALINAVSVAVGEAIDRHFRLAARQAPAPHQIQAAFEALQSNVLSLRYETDANEQHSRRETVRVFGVPENVPTNAADQGGDDARAAEEKDLETKVLKIFQESGANVMHRTGKKREGGRPVLVRFVSRKKKAEVMRCKRAPRKWTRQTTRRST
ncbi:hypothetical protein BaRGS_00004772 [Batillaria attramentaria]|uniref:Uncharacterized protein n=1 Tax=Batillaria attramentaria TaxID=370345 RepID=A0ABD0LWX7_9CAEN